jgi:hypothetical protein
VGTVDGRTITVDFQPRGAGMLVGELRVQDGGGPGIRWADGNTWSAATAAPAADVNNEKVAVAVAAVTTGDWESKQLEDLFDQYDTVFPHGNRNAASHRWATFLLDRASQLSPTKLAFFFSGFCPVSGSPLAGSGTPYRYSLPRVAAADGAPASTADGAVHHCCWPCVCDTEVHIKLDSKTVETAAGPQTFTFLVIGDPCVKGELPPDLVEQAPDVTCSGGKLDASTYSDGGHVIIGLLQQPGAADAVAAKTLDGQCAERAATGTTSGMGKIFIEVASINPI